MNSTEDLGVNDILLIEEKLNQCISNKCTFKDFINKLCFETPGVVSNKTRELIISNLAYYTNEIIDWDNEALSKLYSEVFKIACDGKLSISNGLFLEKYIGRLYCILNRELLQLSDVGVIRREIGDYMKSKGYCDKLIFDFQIATSEAANNALIHHGSGSYMFLERDNYLYSYIFDKGQGIHISKLASSIFKKDYSTDGGDLGAGYKIILSKADNVYIKYNSGVKILIEFEVGRYENR